MLPQTNKKGTQNQRKDSREVQMTNKRKLIYQRNLALDFKARREEESHKKTLGRPCEASGVSVQLPLNCKFTAYIPDQNVNTKITNFQVIKYFNTSKFLFSRVYKPQVVNLSEQGSLASSQNIFNILQKLLEHNTKVC